MATLVKFATANEPISQKTIAGKVSFGSAK